MGYKVVESTVYEMFLDKEYLIPRNQRKYVWDANNWEELYSDLELVMLGKSKKHFIGSIVLKKDESGYKEFQVIDGQQRITTFNIVLTTLMILSGELNLKTKFTGIEKHLFRTDSDSQRTTMLSCDANPRLSEFIMGSYKEIEKSFKTSTEVPKMDEMLNKFKCDKVVSECLTYFHNLFQQLLNRQGIDFDILLKAVLSVSYIDIMADSDEDAYTVFEILNARGKELTDFELLRNYLMKNIEDKDLVKDVINNIEDLLGENTKSFIRHYVIHKYIAEKNSPKKNNSTSFKSIVKNEREADKLLLLNDLKLKASYYVKFIDENKCTTLEKKIFSYFKKRRQQQFRPLVLGIMHQLDNKTITKEKYEELLNYLYKFFVSFTVIGEQTSNKITDIVHKYSYLLENEYSDIHVKQFLKSMDTRIPTYVYFEKSLRKIAYSSGHWKTHASNTKASAVRDVLELLENNLDSELGFKDSTLEHVIPDSTSESSVYLGNIILLEKTLNSRCDNKKIEDKIPYYRQSKYKMAKEIADKYDSNTGYVFNPDQRLESFAHIIYEDILMKNINE